MKTLPTACTCSIPPRVEVTIRIALVTFVASTLAVAYLPSAIPPALSQLIGIFGVSFALSLPHVFFIIGAAIPLTIVAIVVGLLGGTALLAAATVSSGVYVAVFAIYALYCTSLSYGADASKTAGFSNILIVSAGLLSLGSWQLVQHGLQITVDFPYEGGNSTQHFLVDAIIALSEKICVAGTECAENLANWVLREGILSSLIPFLQAKKSTYLAKILTARSPSPGDCG